MSEDVWGQTPYGPARVPERYRLRLRPGDVSLPPEPVRRPLSGPAALEPQWTVFRSLEDRLFGAPRSRVLRERDYRAQRAYFRAVLADSLGIELPRREWPPRREPLVRTAGGSVWFGGRHLGHATGEARLSR